MKELDFGKRLIEIRKTKGLTQREVAEMCKVTTRTVQRIESGVVKPRAFTIKIITKTLGFDSYDSSDTGYDVFKESQDSNVRNHTFLWYLKDLFNLKTNPMTKISILSTSVVLITLLSFNLIHTNAQTNPQAEAAATSAAESWLVLVEDEKYGDTWDETAAIFKKAISREDWIQALQSVREPLKKTLNREIQSCTYRISLPNVPDGEYVIIQYETSFENKKSATETITLALEKNDTWRVAGYFIK